MIKLKNILYEGRYNKLVGQIIKDIFKIIKQKKPIDNNVKTKNWDNYFETSKNTNFQVNNYRGDIDVDVELNYLITTNIKKGTYYIDGGVYTEMSPELTIMLVVNPNDIPGVYSDILPVFRDLVRHEIEHLTQRDWNLKYSKFKKRNNALRQKIKKTGLNYKYFMLADEADANIHGLYAKAETLKQPYQKVVDNYLDELVNNKVVTIEQRKEIYDKWKKRIPQIGGIPKLN